MEEEKKYSRTAKQEGPISYATGETWSWVVAVSVTGVNLIKDVRPPSHPPTRRHRVPLPVDETS